MDQQQHWSGYLTALGGAKTIPQTSMPPVAIYQTTDSTIGVSGFLDLTPKRPEIQARYDAMSGNWGGVQATNKALAHGVFSTDVMPLSNNYGKNK
jgi:hypothetical protein